MEIKISNINQITKDTVRNKLSESNKLSKDEIDNYLDILSTINKKQFVYSISTQYGEYILYITAKPTNINFNKKEDIK